MIFCNDCEWYSNKRCMVLDDTLPDIEKTRMKMDMDNKSTWGRRDYESMIAVYEMQIGAMKDWADQLDEIIDYAQGHHVIDVVQAHRVRILSRNGKVKGDMHCPLEDGSDNDDYDMHKFIISLERKKEIISDVMTVYEDRCMALESEKMDSDDKPMIPQLRFASYLSIGQKVSVWIDDMNDWVNTKIKDTVDGARGWFEVEKKIDGKNATVLVNTPLIYTIPDIEYMKEHPDAWDNLKLIMKDEKEDQLENMKKILMER